MTDRIQASFETMGAETGIHRPDNEHGPLQPRRRALDVGGMAGAIRSA